jgi:hypothetical protein
MCYCADFAFDNIFYQLSVPVTDSWECVYSKNEPRRSMCHISNMGIFVIKKDNFLLKLVVFCIGGAQNTDI